MHLARRTSIAFAAIALWGPAAGAQSRHALGPVEATTRAYVKQLARCRGSGETDIKRCFAEVLDHGEVNAIVRCLRRRDIPDEIASHEYGCIYDEISSILF